MNVLHEIDNVRLNKTKRMCFNALVSYTDTKKYNRDVHNQIVINRQIRIKLLVLKIFKQELERRRKEIEQFNKAKSHYSLRLYSKAVQSWVKFVKYQKANREYGKPKKLKIKQSK